MNFTHKTVWITGASSGIGRALALAFSEQGANLILSSRNEKRLDEVKEACKEPGRVRVLSLDLTDFSSFVEKVKTAIGYFKGIDILINNGGISQRSFASETQLQVDQQIFDINYFGTIALTKALLPHFISKKSGQIVVISSILGKIGTPLRSSYAGSKHALHGFFDSLRAEIYDHHIAITIICPGFVNTDVSKNALKGDGSKQGVVDKGTAGGYSPGEFAVKALKVIGKQKQEAVIAGAKESLAIYLKRFLPKLFSRIIRNVDVT